MKRLYLLIIALVAFATMNAQWVNDPATNTFIANTSADAGEIYLSTDPVSGDTYMQWSQFASNGWVPKVQRLNYAGEPQWDANGMEPSHQYALPSYSQGFAMAATTDNAVVSCFSTEEGHSVAVKINADGTYAWGEAGVMLFNGLGGSRTELLAGDDGGVWALATDNTNSYLCYIEADGTLGNTLTITSFGDQICTFGLMVPANNGGVFVVYEKEHWAYTYFYSKEIWVRGYTKDGQIFSPDTLLMSEQTIGGSYIHYVVPDGLGGGYVYIWHPNIGDSFNIHVFHFNQNGASTIMDTNGVPVHSPDPDNLYISAYGTVDPDSHDLLLIYEQTDSYSQTLCKLFINRITMSGDKPWGEGIMILDNGTIPCGGLRIDAFEYGGGFSVVYHKGISMSGGTQSTVEAQGFDMDANILWSTQMCSNTYNKTGDQNSTGFHGGQNIAAWVNSNTGGLYGQNIGQFGEMGEVTPPVPPAPCDAPTDFIGFFTYDDWVHVYGAELTWTAPEETPLHYMLYRENIDNGETASIEVEANDYTLYFDVLTVSGDYIYRLTAVYEDCESDYALTPNGDNYILIEAIVPTSVSEIEYEEIVDIVEIYNVNGQIVNIDSINDLSQGVYIVKGLTASGKAVIRKICR